MTLTNHGDRLLARVITLFILFASCLKSADSGETVRVSGKIEKIDLGERKISVTKSGSDEKIELELTRKSKITRGSEAVGPDALKVGESATIKYDSELMVASTIEIGAKPEILNLEELNSPDLDVAPWVSPDGLEIFWAVRGSDKSIWSARRKTSESLFTDKKRLFAGEAPVLSSDRLEIYFKSMDGETISLATRRSREEEFSRPRKVQSLSFTSVEDAVPRWLTDDGLCLYLSMKVDGTRHDTWITTRSDKKSNWSKPTRIQIALDGELGNARFHQVSATRDNLHLFCAADFTPVGGKTDVRIGILSRKQRTGRFTTWDEIRLPSDGDKHSYKPQFIPATHELFLTSNAFFDDPESAAKRNFDLWVIKDFQPPIDIADATLRSSLDGEWTFVEGTAGGKPIAGQNAESRKISIKGNQYKLSFGEKTIEGRIQFDPNANPIHLDWIPEKGGSPAIAGKVQRGICELTNGGSTLRFCIGTPEGERPTEYDGSPQGQSVQTFKKKN